MNDAPANRHGTAILVGETGILIRGAARAGKSALALAALRRAELLELPAFLVADDQVLLHVEDGCLVACQPPALAGLMEISGIGIVRQEAVERAGIDLVVDLLPPAGIERLPEDRETRILGVALPRIVLPERQASFCADVLHSLTMRSQPRLFVPTALTKS